MAPLGRLLQALLAVALLDPAGAARTQTGVNPIRKVVTMLQMMKEKVKEEGKKEQKLFDKYMCYCDSSRKALTESIAAAETRLPQLESSIKELSSEMDNLKSDVGIAKSDKEDAKGALAQSDEVSKKDHGEVEKEVAEAKANIAAIDKAVQALQKGEGGAFLQTRGATQLRQLSVSLDMSIADRDMISSFLSADQSDGGYKPQSGEIVGILKTMRDKMQADLDELQGKDSSSKQEQEVMSQAKKEQIAALEKQVEEKVARIGEIGVDIVNLEGDLDDTAKSLEEDKGYLADLEKSCKTKKDQWTIREKMRAEELKTLANTIKFLNEDDTLTLFKKTLPSPSFFQVKAASKHKAKRIMALQMVQTAQKRGNGGHDGRLDLITVALRAKRASFDKILKMIDDMVVLLRKEQDDDDKKRDYCKTEKSETAGQLKALALEISDIGKAIDEAKEKMAAVEGEIAALGEGIRELDAQVADSTEQRKEEHSEYVAKLGDNQASQDALHIAKDMLNKFYNPKLHKAQNPSEDELVQMPFFAQVSMHKNAARSRAKPPPPPDTFGDYQKSDQANLGVLQMVDELEQELTVENTKMEADEKEAQIDYEEAMADAAKKRATDAKMVAEKEAVKAEFEARLHKMTQEQKSKQKEEAGVQSYLMDIEAECDWLLENYEVRQEARTAEIDSLRDAKAVLAGADYSLAQQSHK